MTDQEFLEALNIHAEQDEIVLGIRRALALCCRMKPESINADEKLLSFHLTCRPFNDGWDDLMFTFCLEQVFVQIIRFQEGELPHMIPFDAPLREWLIKTIPIVESKVSRKGSG